MANRIILTYEIILPNKDPFYYHESFKPYSNSEIKESQFIKHMGVEFSTLFDQKDKRDLEMPIKEAAIEEDALELSDMSNILLDAIYSIMSMCITEEHFHYYLFDVFRQYNIFYNLIYDVHTKYDLYHNGIYDKTSFLIYIGCYTELLKTEISDKKMAMSVLLNLYNNTNTNQDLAKQLIKKIQNEFSLRLENDTNFSSMLEDTYFCLCSFQNFNSQSFSHNIEIDLLKFDKYISLLRKYKKCAFSRKDEKTIDFISEHNCFCLAKGEKNYYFSLSGFKHDYNVLGSKIEKDLQSYFSNTFIHCKINNEMLSYICEVGNKYIRLVNPVKLKNSSSIYTTNEVGKFYSCCERKLFCNTQEHLSVIYCKYEPCKLCIPAIKDNNVGLFLALIKNPKQLQHILTKNQKNFNNHNLRIKTIV